MSTFAPVDNGALTQAWQAGRTDEVWVGMLAISTACIAGNRWSLCSNVRCRDDLQDIAMDLTVRIMVQLHAGRWDPAKGKLYSWAFTTARNTLLNKLAQRDRYRNHYSCVIDD